jgi:hypothetical protein
MSLLGTIGRTLFVFSTVTAFAPWAAGDWLNQTPHPLLVINSVALLWLATSVSFCRHVENKKAAWIFSLTPIALSPAIFLSYFKLALWLNHGSFAP